MLTLRGREEEEGEEELAAAAASGGEECRLVDEVALPLEPASRIIDDGDDEEDEEGGGGGNEEELVAADEFEVVAGIEGTLLVRMEVEVEAEVDLVSGRVGRRFAHQMRTVVSSEALAIMFGYRGFHATQFTVRVWPLRVEIGCSRFVCQMKILLSVGESEKS